MNYFYQGSKFGNKKTIVDGIKFDSKKEATRYQELCLMQRGGFVKEIILQPKFVLIEKFEKMGVKYRATHYIADFDIYYTDGTREIEDTKGFKTPEFKIKEKMFHFRYPDLKLKIS